MALTFRRRRRREERTAAAPMALSLRTLAVAAVAVICASRRSSAAAFLHSSSSSRASFSSSFRRKDVASIIVALRSSSEGGGKKAKEETFDFDPLLSPHAYPRGIDAGPAVSVSDDESAVARPSEVEGECQGGDEGEEDGEGGDWSPLRIPCDNFPDGFDDTFVNRDRVRAPYQPPPVEALKVKEKNVEEAAVGQQKEAVAGATDLFDVFDPRISPHAYPNGVPEVASIAPDDSSAKKGGEDCAGDGAAFTKTEEEILAMQGYVRLEAHKDGDVGEIVSIQSTAKTTTRSSTTTTTRSTVTAAVEKVGILLVDHGSRKESSNKHLERLAELYQETLEVGAVAAEEATIEEAEEMSRMQDGSTINGGKEEEFDPLLSPHAYPNGIDAGASTTTSSSLSLPSPPPLGRTYIVQAAHMEIASPTIEDGIRSLAFQHQVDTIVVAPYFLSPGRHVKEDVPRLVDEAVKGLEEGATTSASMVPPVITTNAVGSNIDAMIGAIGGLVDDALESAVVGDVSSRKEDVREERSQQQRRLGGFFGDVQRMMDEQL